MIRAERIDCALHERTFSLSLAAGRKSWRGILLGSGSGAIQWDEGRTALPAHSLTWAPWDDAMSLRIGAGSTGMHFAVGADELANAIGHNAEAHELRRLSETQHVARLAPGGRDAANAAHAFRVLLEESSERGSGVHSMIEAQLRTILVILLRQTAGKEMLGKGVGRTAHTLQRFRQLMETNFRERWPVARYAEEIGVSADRLHDLCTRHLGRSPKRLLQDRTLFEARQMLSNTSMTIDQIAATLGFRDTGHFSRFFKAEMDTPPATFRRAAAATDSARRGPVAQDFADWP